MTSEDPTVAELRNPSGLIGQTVSHYKILQHLGSGGMSVVYKAVDNRLGRTVALKFLSPDPTRDPIAKERFIREARTVSALDHPNICTIYEVDEIEGGQLCLAMAYYEGKTLRELLREGPVPLSVAVDIARQTARGLARAHEAGIIHRDIKPDNVLITHRGEVKILDFGIAKAIDAPSLTRVGISVGTPMYMSPEQVAGDPTDQRADIWSLGVVLYEMIRSRRRSSGASDSEKEGRLDPASSELSIAFDRVIAKCLKVNAEERFRDAGELSAALDGLGLAPGGPASPTRKWLPYSLLAAAVLLVCLFFAYRSFQVGRSAKEEAVQSPSASVQQAAASEKTRIAVLPFENLGRAEDTYFADGITEEITSRLAAIPKLGVISRTSASQYKDLDRSMQQIGKDLNVAYVLEGTVRWEHSPEGSSRVLVTPQLIRVADDTHLWSAKYEREMEEVFKVQSEIAAKIIEQLNLKLVQPEWQAIHARSTNNMGAYHAYLRGLAHLEGLLPVSEESGRAAIARFEEAVRLDPAFALAYARLSRAQSALYHAQFDLSEESLRKARSNAEKALELQPDLSEGHVALGYYHYWGYRDYDAALRELSIAAEVQPNNNEITEAIGYIKRRQGLFEEAVEHLENAFVLDPRNPFLARAIGITLMYLRRYEDADKYYDLSMSLDPSRTSIYLSSSLNRLLWKGSAREAREILAKANPGAQDNDTIMLAWYHQELLEGRPAQALQRLAQVQKEGDLDQNEMAPKDLLAAEAYALLGDQERATSLYKSAAKALEKQVQDHPDDARARSALALALAGFGREEEAIQQARLATELSREDAYVKIYRLRDLAHVYAKLGEEEAALEQLEHLLSIPSLISPQLLKIDPRWKSLRRHPRFETLIRGPRPQSTPLVGLPRG